MTEIDVQFSVLGPLEMKVRGALLPTGTPKQRAVLAMLVINLNRAVEMDALIDAAWPHRVPESARSTVHSYVYNLRQVISDAGIDPHKILASIAPGYRLTVPDSHSDLGRFRAERLAGMRAAAVHQFDEASRRLTSALSEWRGPALKDLREFDFADTFAKALDEDKLTAHTALAEAEIACGRPSAVVGDLEALAAEHPYREPLWAQLIAAYYVAERQADALNAYRRLKSALSEDLGIDPGPTVQALHSRILRQLPLDIHTTAEPSRVTTLLEPAFDASAVAVLRDSAGRAYPLVGALTRIGRSSENDIVLPNANVSRRHAEIRHHGGTFLISDLNSANGVYVLGNRIDSSINVKAGDVIRIGGYQFTLEL